MKAIKQILVFTVATVVVVLLVACCAHFIGFRNPGFAFIVNWLVMTWVAVIGGVLHVSLPLPPRYYRIRPFESDGRIYEFLGTCLFKRLVSCGPLLALNPTIRFSGDRSSLSGLAQKMRDGEAGHLIIFLIMLVILGYAVINGWWDLAAWLLLFNILINVYPMMLQRYNRARLVPILERAERSTCQETEA